MRKQNPRKEILKRFTHFTEGASGMSNRRVEKYSTSFVIRKMQVRTNAPMKTVFYKADQAKGW